MRHFGRMLFVCAAAVLTLMLLPGLIHSSQADNVPAEEQRACLAVISCVADCPTQQSSVIPQQHSPAREQLTGCTQQAEACPQLVLCDGNGWPLTCGTWVRAAWAANPPESIPGL